MRKAARLAVENLSTTVNRATVGATADGPRAEREHPSDGYFEDWEPLDEDAPDAPPSSDTRRQDASVSSGRTVVDVLRQWQIEGPLVHEPTGLRELDDLTGGGPVYGTRWFVVGAPDAGKTALVVHLAHVFAARGVAVGILAVDEEPGDLLMRLAQRCGISRQECEARGTDALATIRSEMSDLPIRFYDGAVTIEAAAMDLATFARAHAEADPATHPRGPRAMLIVDSLQTARCEADVALRIGKSELSLRETVSGRVQALRSVATRYRLISIATSEMNRNAYRSHDAARNTDDLASAAESRAVEYSGRVVLALRSVPEEKGLVEIRVAKNKHGPRGDSLYIEIDRNSQVIVERDYRPAKPDRNAESSERSKQRVIADAVLVARVLQDNPGVGARRLRDLVNAAHGLGHDRVGAAIARLGAAVRQPRGPRNAILMTLDLDKLAEDVAVRLGAPRE